MHSYLPYARESVRMLQIPPKHKVINSKRIILKRKENSRDIGVTELSQKRKVNIKFQDRQQQRHVGTWPACLVCSIKLKYLCHPTGNFIIITIIVHYHPAEISFNLSYLDTKSVKF